MERGDLACPHFLKNSDTGLSEGLDLNLGSELVLG